MKSLIIGTRGSPLALAQVEIVRSLLQKAHPSLAIETKVIKTGGDTFTNLSLSANGGKGLFTKEIEDQLLQGEINVAIHSLKDLPTVLPKGLTIGAVPVREDARDVFISTKARSIEELAKGAHVATSSIRRRAQLLARRPDLQVEEIRGNVETRLRKLADNTSLDAIILAAAGLRRLGLWKTLDNLHWQEIDFTVMLPAAGQGAIACEVRESDSTTLELMSVINDADSAASTTAERAFLQALGGGCQTPYAAYAGVVEENLRLWGATFGLDGQNARRTKVIGPKSMPRELGERAAQQVLS